jgi:hypothetical protein
MALVTVGYLVAHPSELLLLLLLFLLYDSLLADFGNN